LINREKLNRILTLVESNPNIRADLDIQAPSGRMRLWIWRINSAPFNEQERHEVLAQFTPLVGRVDKKRDLGDIDFVGSCEDLEIRINCAEACTIVGYKIRRKQKPKMVAVEGEYEEDIERVPVTDCDIKSGKYSAEDLEVVG